MAFFKRYRTYESEGDIFQVPHGTRTTKSAMVTNAYISTDKEGLKQLPAGIFIAKVFDSNGNTIFRPLPHATVTVASSTSSPRFKVAMPYVLYSGDQLFITDSYTTLTVGSTAIGTLTYAGQTVSYTPTGAANVTEAATKWASYLNTTSLSRTFRFLSSADKLYVLTNDGFSALQVTPTGGLGTTAVTTAVNSTAIGTVQSIDTTTEEVVLTANAAVVVPVGFNVGAKVNEIYGLYSHSLVFTDYRSEIDCAIVDEAKLKKARLPFWAEYIRLDCPRLEARYQW